MEEDALCVACEELTRPRSKNILEAGLGKFALKIAPCSIDVNVVFGLGAPIQVGMGSLDP